MQQDPKDLFRKWFQGRYFNFRAGYYTGRGPNLGDLNSKILEIIYQGMKKDVGQTEATNFVRFVNNLNDLSATAFIVAFERFWYNDCQVVKIEQQAGDGNTLDGRGEELYAQGFALIASVLTQSPDREVEDRISMQVKAEFVLNHQSEIPEAEHRPVVLGLQYSPYG